MRVRRHFFKELLVLVGRAVLHPGRVVKRAQPQMRLGLPDRIEPQSLIQVDGGFRAFFDLKTGFAKVVVDIGGFRVVLNRLIQRVQGALVVLERQEDFSEIQLSGRESGLLSQRLAVGFFRILLFLHVEQRGPEFRPCLEIFWVPADNPIQERGRFSEILSGHRRLRIPEQRMVFPGA